MLKHSFPVAWRAGECADCRLTGAGGKYEVKKERPSCAGGSPPARARPEARAPSPGPEVGPRPSPARTCPHPVLSRRAVRPRPSWWYHEWRKISVWYSWWSLCLEEALDGPEPGDVLLLLPAGRTDATRGKQWSALCRVREERGSSLVLLAAQSAVKLTEVGLLVLCQVGDEERQGRVDPALLEESLKLALHTVVQVLKLGITFRQVSNSVNHVGFGGLKGCPLTAGPM